MILTNCAACAAPLAHNAPRCVRCHTRYCNATCQHSRRYKEAKALLRKFIPVAERDFGNSHLLTLMMRMNYAGGLYEDSAATLDDVREAVTTLEDTARIARRVFGSAHPKAVAIEQSLRDARAVLHARETPPPKTLPGDEVTALG